MKYLIPIAFLALPGLTACTGGNGKPSGQDTGFNAADSFYLDQQELVGRHCKGCSRFPPGTYVLPGTAGDRIAEYQAKLTGCKLQGLDTEAVYSATGTLKFLQMLTKSPKNYSGFRAYWVRYPYGNSPDSGSGYVPDKQCNKFALVFVPTYPNQDPESDYHMDDTTNCVVIRADSIEHIDPKFVRMWMHRADKQVLQPMQQEGITATGHPTYQETRSLWYDIAFIQSQPWPWRNGLIDIIQCRMKCDCKSVHAKFAAFTKKDPNKHQLCAIFMIGSDLPESLSPFISLFYPDLSDFGRHRFLKATANSGGSDTGKPCPPPSPCTDSVGALLSSPN